MNRLLGPEEYAYWLFEQRGAFNTVLAARLRGEIDGAALATALSRLGDRHPVLRSRVVQEGRVRFAPAENLEIPLRIVSRDGEDHWPALFQEELSTPVPLLTGPLWRAALLPGEGTSDLLLSFSHLAADGGASVMLLRDLLSLLSGASLPPRPEPPAFEELVPPDAFGSPDGAEQLGAWWSRETTRRLAGWSAEQLAAHLPAVGPTRVHQQLLPPEVTSAIVTRCRAEGTTVHGAACAAGLLALAEGEPDPTRCRHIVSLRERVEPAFTDDPGLCVSQVTTTHAAGGGAPFWDLARQVRAELDSSLARGEPYDALLQSVRAVYTNTPPQEEPAALSVSNLGRVDLPPAIGPVAVETIRVAGSVRVDSPVLSLVTYRDRLSWMLNVPSTWARAGEAAALSAEALRRLRAACGT
ncbi:MAG: phthiocerol/phthiodiolone dimycocerosyl transferase family protein [Armatimonadota bacterium]